jgi:hypothetical protein
MITPRSTIARPEGVRDREHRHAGAPPIAEICQAHLPPGSGIERALMSGRTGMPQRSADKIRMPGNRTFGAAV